MSDRICPCGSPAAWCDRCADAGYRDVIDYIKKCPRDWSPQSIVDHVLAHCENRLNETKSDW